MGDTNHSKLMCEYEKDDPFREIMIFNFALTVCIGVFGLISNSVVVAVNRRIKNLTSTDVYITLLAITDNLMIISVSLIGFRYAYKFLMPPEQVDWTATGMVAMVGILFMNFSHCLNTFIIVLLNIDRYLRVKFLAKCKRWCTPRRAVILSIFAAVGSMLFTTPRFVENVPLLIHNDKTVNSCTGLFKLTVGIGANTTYTLVYRFIIYLIVLYAVPLIILVFTSTTLIHTLYQRRKWLNSMQAETRSSGELRLQRVELNAIVTLVAITLVFMVCQVPDIILQFAWKLARQHGLTISFFTYQILIINSSINFIIYAVSSRVFRQRLREMLTERGDRPGSSGDSLPS